MHLLTSLKRRLFGTQPQTITTGPAAGLRFDPGPSNPAYGSGDNELPVQSTLQRCLQPGDVFYDIGANVGFLSVVGAHCVGPQGAVHAFEPLPANVALVRRNASLNGFAQIVVHPIAVGDVTGRAQLVVAAYSGGSALAAVEAPPDATGESIEVDISTVDALVERGLPPPTLVKIDVEGAELLVLKGMELVCARHAPRILYELDGVSEEALEPKRVECERWLLDHHYSVSELELSYVGQRWRVRHFLATPRQARQASST